MACVVVQGWIRSITKGKRAICPMPARVCLIRLTGIHLTRGRIRIRELHYYSTINARSAISIAFGVAGTTSI